MPPGGWPEAEHPVVARHPGNGRKMLYVNSGFTVRIPQLAPHESAALLAMLNRHPVTSVDDLHRDTRLPKPTVVRLLQALIADSYVEQISRGAGYRLSAKVKPLCSVTSARLGNWVLRLAAVCSRPGRANQGAL